MPHGRSHRRRGHETRGSELELLGSAVHVFDSTNSIDSHRRRRSGNRTQLSDRAWRGGRRQACARRTRDGRRGQGAPRSGKTAGGNHAWPQGVRRKLGSPVELRSVPAPARAHSCGAAQSGTRGRLHRDGCRLEQERCRPAVSHHRPWYVHHAERVGDDGLRAVGGARREDSASRPLGGRPDR